MKLLNNFNDYILDLLLESFFKGEAPLILSDRFRELIKNIDHPISIFLIDNEVEERGNKHTYIDLDDSGIDMVSFITSTKAAQVITGKNKPEVDDVNDQMFINAKNSTNLKDQLYSKHRSPTTIGKLINKLFPKKFEPSGNPGEDIQSFTDKFKSLRDVQELEKIEGDDIIEYYKEKHHLLERIGSLGKSCMRYEECEEYLEFYSKNNDVVSMLILKSKNDEGEEKIRARALVWKLSEPEDRYFMDRVYTNFTYDQEKFISHAIENGWLYKKYQDSSETTSIIDPLNDTSEYITLVVEGVKDSHKYPYLDTLKYFYVDDMILTNDEDYLGDDYYKLEETDGTYSNQQGIWSDYYNEYIDTEDYDYIYCEWGDEWRHIDDAEYLDYYGEWATEEYINRYLEECDYYDTDDGRYRKSEDTVTLYGSNELSCRDYAENNLFYSEYLDEFLAENDAVWSDYHSTYIYRDESVEVYLNTQQSKEDWRVDDESDGSWWEWDYDGEKYDDDVTEEELREYNDLDDDD